MTDDLFPKFLFEEKILDSQLEQFKNSKVLNGIKSVKSGGLDEVDEISDQVSLSNTFDKAFGKSLELLGEEYSVIRGNLVDEDYRWLLKLTASMLMNSSSIPGLIRSLRFLLNTEPENVIVENRFPAGISVQVWGISSDLEARVLDLFGRVFSSGVQITFGSALEDGAFRFSSLTPSDAEDIVESEGFFNGDDISPGGGGLAGVIGVS